MIGQTSAQTESKTKTCLLTAMLPCWSSPATCIRVVYDVTRTPADFSHHLNLHKDIPPGWLVWGLLTRLANSPLSSFPP